jgi:hypothetical protein
MNIGTGFAKALALAGLLGPLSACIVAAEPPPYHEADQGYGDATYVAEAPPPPQSDVVIGVAPGPNYVWVGGYWGRYHNTWHWNTGRWAARPHPEARWEPGHWDHHPGRGYTWHGGHWH